MFFQELSQLFFSPNTIAAYRLRKFNVNSLLYQFAFIIRSNIINLQGDLFGDDCNTLDCPCYLMR